MLIDRFTLKQQHMHRIVNMFDRLWMFWGGGTLKIGPASKTVSQSMTQQIGERERVLKC